MQAQLLGDRLPLLDRLARRAIDDRDQDAGALDVTQEVVAEPAPGVCAFDEPRDVGHDRGPLAVFVERDHAEVGGHGGERIVPDLRPRLGERRQQGRLAGIRRTDKADVGDQLQLQLDPALVSRRPLFGVLGSSVRRRGEASVAAAAAAAAGHDQPIIGLHQLADPLAVGADDGARRHTHHEVPAVATVRLAAHSTPAGGRTEVALAVEVAQGRHTGLHDEHHVAALAAITAVGAAAWHVRLAPEGAGAIATVAAGDQDAGAISEHVRRA